MKTKLKKILTCIPFCIPFAYALLHLDYFGNYGWLHCFVDPMMLILPILGGFFETASAVVSAIIVIVTAVLLTLLAYILDKKNIILKL